MTVYRGPREAPGAGACSRTGAGTLPPAPNIMVNRPVCPASVASLPGIPGSPLPETTIAWASPGPVILAWEGPFASAGVASVTAAAMLMPAARAMTAVSLRSMAAPSVAPHCYYTATRWQVLVPTGAVSAGRIGDGERGCPAEVAFQAQRDLPGAPDQGVAGGAPGRGRGQRAVTVDVHQFLWALDPQAPGAVHLYLGHVAQVNEFLEHVLVEVARELVHPHQAVRRPAVDQGHDPPPVADHDFAGPAERRRHQDGEGDLVACPFQRHPPLARQGGAASRRPRRAGLLAQLDTGEPEHMDDRRPPLRGGDQDGQQGDQHHQRGMPSQPAAKDTPGRPRVAAACPPLEPLPHGPGEVSGWRHLNHAAHRPQLGLHRALPPGPVSHGKPRSAPQAPAAR